MQGLSPPRPIPFAQLSARWSSLLGICLSLRLPQDQQLEPCLGPNWYATTKCAAMHTDRGGIYNGGPLTSSWAMPRPLTSSWATLRPGLVLHHAAWGACAHD